MSNFDFTIQQRATFNPVLKYSQPQFVVKPITGITKSGQAVVTAPTHGLAVDWPVWIVNVLGMTQINHQSSDLQVAGRAYFGYFVDVNTLRLNVDASRFQPYASGGELLYHPPVDLTGFTAKMDIRQAIADATPLISLTTTNGRITLGGVNGTVTLFIAAVDTALLTFTSAVYDLDLVSATGVVTRLLSGNVLLSKGVTV